MELGSLLCFVKSDPRISCWVSQHEVKGPSHPGLQLEPLLMALVKVGREAEGSGTFSLQHAGSGFGW